MTNQVILAENEFSKQLQDLNNIQSICKKLMETKHYAKLGEEGIHAIVARAKTLGIHPFEALNGGFHVINGKVGMSTEMMSALARKRGHSIIKDKKSNNEICIMHGKRADNGDEMTIQFTKQDAIEAGLWGTLVWKKYPAVMLYNRAMSMLFRQLFSDLSLGVGYVEDELKEIAKIEDYAVNPEKLPLSESEILPIEIKKETPIVYHLTETEGKAVTALLSMASEENKKKIQAIMDKRGFKDHRQLPRATYDNIMANVLPETKSIKESIENCQFEMELSRDGE